MNTLTITRPDDWHLHLRDGDALKSVLPHTARQFARAIVMPNLRPPVTSTDMALAYRDRILQALPNVAQAPSPARFEPLMTLYLTDNTAPQEIAAAKASGLVHGVKLYPAGATTNSDSGVTDIANCSKALEAMEKLGMPLLVKAATSGSPKFFLGTDSAPHPKSAKEASCGCAGIYTAHAAIELYAEAFEHA